MSKKIFVIITILTLVVSFFTGCTKTDGTKTYITLMTVPTEATIPNGLHLDAILSVTNTDPTTGATSNTQFGIFGFTNTQGEVEYYAYGKKESVLNGQTHLMEQGFYRINYAYDGQTIALSLKDGSTSLSKVNAGNGTPTNYEGELPFAFYTPTGQTGLYTFTDASGAAVFRVYETFAGSNGNFFPANADGTMVAGSLPVNATYETTLQSQGSKAASRLLTTPITCQNIPLTFEV